MNYIIDFINERTRDFTGREWVFAALNDWLNSGTSRSFLLKGEPGSGKSALAARLVQMSLGEAQNNRYPRLGKGCLTFHHFCQAQTITTLDPLRFVEALALKLADRYPAYNQALLNMGEQHINISTRQVVGSAAPDSKIAGVVIEELHISNISSQVAFDRVIRGPLEKLCSPDFKETILIMVDALDESLPYNPHHNLVSLLGQIAYANSTDLPPQVRFLFTSRAHPDVLHHIGDESLDLIDDSPDGVDDVKEYAYRRLQSFDETQRETLADRVAETGRGNFLYARYVLNDLTSWAESLIDLERLTLPQGLDDVYRQFLKRTLGNDLLDWKKRYRPLLGILAVAHGKGLTAEQLAGVANLSQSETDDLLAACAQYLNEPGAEGLYSIYHHSFRQFLLVGKTYGVYPAEANQNIARYFLALYSSNWSGCSDVYAIQYTPTHLLEAVKATAQQFVRKELVGSLFDLLTDFEFIEVKVGHLGVDALLTDMRAIKNLKQEESEAQANAVSLRRVLDREAHNLRGWSPRQRPAYFAQQMHNWAVDLNLPFLESAAARRLTQVGQPYLALVWRAARESQELERVLSGHIGAVVAVAVTDKQQVVSIDERNTFRVWDAGLGQTLHAFHGAYHGERTLVRAAALTPDGRFAVSALWDERALEIWDIDARQLMHSIPQGAAGARDIAIGADGRYCVIAHASDELKVWDVATGQHLHTIYDVELSAERLAISPDGRKVLGECPFWRLRFWDVQTGAVLQTLKGSTGRRIYAIAFNQDGSRAAAATTDTIKLWDMDTGEEIQSFSVPDLHRNYINDLVFSSDGRCLLSCSADTTIGVWNIKTGEPQGTLYGHAGTVLAIAISSDGDYAVSGSGDRTLRIWNLRSHSSAHRRFGHVGEVNSVAISSDSRRGVSAANDGVVKIWDLKTGNLLHDLTEHQGKVNAVALTTDDQILISASEDKTLRAWDMQTGQVLRVLKGHHEAVNAVAVATDGKFIISASADSTLRVWDMQRDKASVVLDGHFKSVLAVELRADNKYAVSSSADGTIRLWDVDSGEEVAQRGPSHSNWVRDVTFALGGQFVVTASDDRTLVVWNLPRNKLMYALIGHEDWVRVVKNIPFSPNVVSASDDKTLKVWNVLSGELEHDLVGHTGGVYAVAVNAEGRRAASVSFDCTLRIWDLFAGQELAMTTLDGKLNCVTFSPDGQLLLIGDWGGNVYCLRYVESQVF